MNGMYSTNARRRERRDELRRVANIGGSRALKRPETNRTVGRNPRLPSHGRSATKTPGPDCRFADGNNHPTVSMSKDVETTEFIPARIFGLIVDYNGMLKSLRAALAQYALGDDADVPEEIVAPIEERVQAPIGKASLSAHLAAKRRAAADCGLNKPTSAEGVLTASVCNCSQ